MSYLNKFIFLFLFNISVFGLTSTETPLFDPSLNARDIGLAKASFSDNNFTNILINPAAIANTKGISIQSNEYLGIDYSSITIVNQFEELTFGIHYIGSSINTIKRSVREGNLLKQTEDIVPYQYHNLNLNLARQFSILGVGVSASYQTLILDNLVQQTVSASGGIWMMLIEKLKFGVSVRNFKNTTSISNALQKKYPILSSSLQYALNKRTKVFLAFIENKNEIRTHSTFHYSIEHYVNDYIPLRGGIDHNRYSFGIGLFIDPFEIDIGWAQSRDSEVSDQVTIGFSYGFEEKNHLY